MISENKIIITYILSMHQFHF